MLTLDQELRPHPDAVDTELDGNELALLHLESKRTPFSFRVGLLGGIAP